MMHTNGTAMTAAGEPKSVSTGLSREVSPKDVQNWLQEGECVLIDVREPDEQRATSTHENGS